VVMRILYILFLLYVIGTWIATSWGFVQS
jgi:hypothetical protein